MQGIQGSQTVSRGQAFGPCEDRPSRIHEIPMHPIALKLVRYRLEVGLGKIAGVASSGERGQGLDREDGR